MSGKILACYWIASVITRLCNDWGKLFRDENCLSSNDLSRRSFLNCCHLTAPPSSRSKRYFDVVANVRFKTCTGEKASNGGTCWKC